MVIQKHKEMVIFLNYKQDCLHKYEDDWVYYCNINEAICDMDFCPLLKKAYDIDDFVDVIERMRTECKD